MSFLNAEWRKLAIANYAIDSDVLSSYIPEGTELDLYDNKCYVSLVAFMFVNTRVLGIKVPFHVNFEEANLRFYVKRFENNEWKRGVVFIKEIVPKSMITFIANLIYKEHYQTMSMRHRWGEEKGRRIVEYNWGRDKQYGIKVVANKNVSLGELDPMSSFITEHYWGYTKYKNKTFSYQVTHPTWKSYQVHDCEVAINFGELYGTDFSFLNNQKPDSVILAEGSAITVEKRVRII